MKRKARIFLDKVFSVDLRKNQLEEAFDKLFAIEIGTSRFDFERMVELRLDTGDEYPIRRIETNFWPY